MSHGNGVRGLRELVVVTTNPDVDVVSYAKAAQSSSEKHGDDWAIVLPGGFRLSLVSPARYRERYGEQCVEADGRGSFFGAIVFDAPEPGRIYALAASIPNLRVMAGRESLTVQIPFLNTLLEFRKG